MSISTIRNLAIAADAVCWGALVFFSVHFFTCPLQEERRMKSLQVNPEIYKKKFILRSYYQSAVNNARDEFLGHPIAFSIEGSALMAYFMGFGWRRFSLLETAPEEEKE